jgi:hypothetical protein
MKIPLQSGLDMDWKNKFDLEIQRALDVRARGNEGQARVFARRAAGVIVREYFQRCGLPVRSSSAYDLLKELLELPGQSVTVRWAAECLTLRVTEEFKLPIDVDLIQAAQTLAESLLPGSEGPCAPSICLANRWDDSG